MPAQYSVCARTGTSARWRPNAAPPRWVPSFSRESFGLQIGARRIFPLSPSASMFSHFLTIGFIISVWADGYVLAGLVVGRVLATRSVFGSVWSLTDRWPFCAGRDWRTRQREGFLPPVSDCQHSPPLLLLARGGRNASAALSVIMLLRWGLLLWFLAMLARGVPGASAALGDNRSFFFHLLGRGVPPDQYVLLADRLQVFTVADPCQA